mgnify:CR=1 FL=1
MKQGFVKVAAVTPNMRVADVEYNVNEICRMIDETTEQGAKVIAFPELCITGYTCGDLFSQEILLREAKQGLYRIAEYTKEKMHLFLWESLMKSRESFIIQQRH